MNKKIDCALVPKQLLEDTRLSNAEKFLWVLIAAYEGEPFDIKRMMIMTGDVKPILNNHLRILISAGWLKVKGDGYETVLSEQE